MTPEPLALVCEVIVKLLATEPDREWTTSEIAKATTLEPKFLLAVAPYFPPYVKRGPERKGYGAQAGKMIKPWIWTYGKEN